MYLYRPRNGKKNHITNRAAEGAGEGKVRALCGVRVTKRDWFAGEVNKQTRCSSEVCQNCLRELNKKFPVNKRPVFARTWQEMYEELQEKYEYLHRGSTEQTIKLKRAEKEWESWKRQYFDHVQETAGVRATLAETSKKLLLCIKERDKLYTLLLHHATLLRRR